MTISYSEFPTYTQRFFSLRLAYSDGTDHPNPIADANIARELTLYDLLDGRARYKVDQSDGAGRPKITLAHHVRDILPNWHPAPPEA